MAQRDIFSNSPVRRGEGFLQKLDENLEKYGLLEYALKRIGLAAADGKSITVTSFGLGNKEVQAYQTYIEKLIKAEWVKRITTSIDTHACHLYKSTEGIIADAETFVAYRYPRARLNSKNYLLYVASLPWEYSKEKDCYSLPLSTVSDLEPDETIRFALVAAMGGFILRNNDLVTLSDRNSRPLRMLLSYKRTGILPEYDPVFYDLFTQEELQKWGKDIDLDSGEFAAASSAGGHSAEREQTPLTQRAPKPGEGIPPRGGPGSHGR